MARLSCSGLTLAVRGGGSPHFPLTLAAGGEAPLTGRREPGSITGHFCWPAPGPWGHWAASFLLPLERRRWRLPPAAHPVQSPGPSAPRLPDCRPPTRPASSARAVAWAPQMLRPPDVRPVPQAVSLPLRSRFSSSNSLKHTLRPGPRVGTRSVLLLIWSNPGDQIGGAQAQ